MGNELVKFTRELIGTNEKLDTALSVLEKETICLVPRTINLGIRPEIKMSLSLIPVDVNNKRDTFPLEGGEVLHLQKLKEISSQGGFKITHSKVAECQTDEKGRIMLIKHEIGWQRMGIDGIMREGLVTGTYDYQADKLYRSGQVDKRNKFAFALAESNAHYRAIKDAFPNLKSSYSKDELKKPILVYAAVEDKNELLKSLPPEVQTRLNEAVAAKALGVSDLIYGNAHRSPALTEGAPATPPPPPVPAQEPVKAKNGAVDANYTEITNTQKLSKAEQNHITAQEYKDVPQDVRTNKILDLCKLTGFLRDGKQVTVGMIEKSQIAKQIDLIEKLLNLKDEQEDEGTL